MIDNQEVAQAEPGAPISCNQVESILANTQLVPRKLYFVGNITSEVFLCLFSQYSHSSNEFSQNLLAIYGRSETRARKI